MMKNRRILLIEPTAGCTRAIVEQLSNRLSSLIPRTVSTLDELNQVVTEENWSAIVCNSSLPATDTLHAFFTNLPGMACQIRLNPDDSLDFPYVSEGCFALLGIAPLTLELHAELLVDRIHRDDREMFFSSLQSSATLASHWNWEGRILLPNSDEIKWVNLRASHRETSPRGIVWEGFMVNITQNKVAEQEIKQSRHRLRELSSHIDTIKEEERMRIAREIHDEIGVLLTALKMDLSWLRNRLPDSETVLQEKAKSMSDLLDTAGVAANNLVHSLRPGFLDVFGIVAAIEIEAKEFTKRTSIPCRVSKSKEHIELPENQSITLFRVFQETLNNIMKHASAKRVQVQLLIDETCVDLIVSDDGVGFDANARNKPRSFGLRGIQERIGHLGGKVTISSELGKGTQVAVCVPLDGEACQRIATKQQAALF